ncbi:HAMP domain-containing sensor histidine kinase [Anaerocolumna sp. AGMB13020]|uniref:HAMP domain-containing sensor histidine kinase n=1 Tax=Anaerocolumna sp. AGMB13020 TaxID=3081750 RepID=UPI0029541DBB|nr:HAMP domain-containing sensor histidine kinase [Anaerocolumna sp. AGMB13020]WOO37770.1 HAMP domain-containing sensor histidine kinase [Anaerocolumna sp. AGMB13020]
MEKQEKKRKVRVSLRLYFSMVSITTLCSACIVSLVLVLGGMKLFFHGDITLPVVIIIALLVCGLTILLGGTMLWFGSIHLTKPLEEISRAVKKVAEGDFTVHIDRNERSRGEYEYSNEIDELAVNFNTMAAELSGMDYMRKDFMSNVSHEVKTPVAAITGLSEILLEGGLTAEEQKEYLQLINKESLRLSRLCENMLRMSRLDHQQIVVKADNIRVDEQIRKCIIMLSEKWPDKVRNYEIDCGNLVIQSNADLLMQVWANLIDNAIKYSAEDSSIYITGRIHNNNYLLVTIRDEGDGISIEKQAKIFEKFYQCEESHKKVGNGLGLSIVKRILELLGGEITCSSEEGKGTVMEVTVPLK